LARERARKENNVTQKRSQWEIVRGRITIFGVQTSNNFM